MPDVLIVFLNYCANKGLPEAYDTWSRSSRARNIGDETKASFRLAEMLARETRIWVLSRLVSMRQLPRDIVLPPVKTDFGKELNFLEELQKHPVLKELASASPAAGDGFVQLQEVLKLAEKYLKTSDYTLDQFKNDFNDLEPGTHETWLQTVRMFQRFRNLDGHDAAQPNAEGIPTYVSDKLAHLAPSIVQAMRVRIDWLIRQVAAHLGQYELQSKVAVAEDRDFSVQDLLKAKPILGSATQLYVLYDEDRIAKDLFARLESNEQVQSAMVDAAEISESPMFRSAKNGRFLPLIGPAFGLPDQLDSPGANEIVLRSRIVVGDPRFNSLERFLKRVVSRRLGFEIQDLNPLGPSGPCDTPRVRLVGELASLASQATKAFGHSLAKWGSPLKGKGEVLDDADVEPLRKRIGEVSDFLKSLYQDRTMSVFDRIDLGVDAIVNGLLVLDRHEVEDRRLSLNSLTWLDDLVWHALRWDAPLYPDSQALDLQLSLGVQREPDRGFAVWGSTTASSGAALFLEPLKLTEYLESWSRRMENRIRQALAGNRGWRDPYVLVAKAMTLCLEMRQGGAVDSGVGNKKNVFVVDATFDQRMCGALEKVGAKTAVVYPIDIIDDGNKYPAWAMRRFPRPAEANDEYSVLWDECDRMIDYQDVPRIIVIKPFGAPLESPGQLDKAVERAKATLQKFPIDEHGKAKPSRYRTSPRFLFDDVSILKDIVRMQDSMPPGFRQAIHDESDPFELFFMGYAIEEDGRRARMIADVRPANDVGKEAGPQPRYLSQPPPSGLAHHYLKRAGFMDDAMPLDIAMKDLASSLDQHVPGGARP